MLLQFTVENFLSFRDKTILNMVAAEGVDHREEQVVRLPGLPPVLRCAALYGANASGKSNLVRALAFARDLMHHGRSSGKPVGVRPFKLDEESRKKPSRFELELHVDGKHYAYGFLASAPRIEAEWLLVIDGEREVELFDRTAGEAQPGKPVIRVGEAMSGDPDRRQFLRFVAEGTRPNQLFLTELRERNFVELSPLFGWLDTLFTIEAGARLPFAKLMATDRRLRGFVGDFLRDLDTGVQSLYIRRSTIDRSELPADVIADVEEVSWGTTRRGHTVVEDDATGKLELFKIRLRHQGRGGVVTFKLNEESDGTRRLIDLAPFLYLLRLDEPQSPARFVIDELDRSLHPVLTREYVRAFLESTPPASRGQLVFTTHDTLLLTHPTLPRDSTWFVEKDAQGASTLYSLAEYKDEHLRHLRSLERGYLQGRFGAVPYLKKTGSRSAR